MPCVLPGGAPHTREDVVSQRGGPASLPGCPGSEQPPPRRHAINGQMERVRSESTGAADVPPISAIASFKVGATSVCVCDSLAACLFAELGFCVRVRCFFFVVSACTYGRPGRMAPRGMSTHTRDLCNRRRRTFTWAYAVAKGQAWGCCAKGPAGAEPVAAVVAAEAIPTSMGER